MTRDHRKPDPNSTDLTNEDLGRSTPPHEGEDDLRRKVRERVEAPRDEWEAVDGVEGMTRDAREYLANMERSGE